MHQSRVLWRRKVDWVSFAESEAIEKRHLLIGRQAKPLGKTERVHCEIGERIIEAEMLHSLAGISQFSLPFGPVQTARVVRYLEMFW